MLDLDSGQWYIVHPGELVATFLLPLPDPVGLADGTVLPSHRWLEPAALNLLEPWLDELWLQKVGGSEVQSCREWLGDEPRTGVPVNWSNKLAPRASIQFHQVNSDIGLRMGIEPAMRLAEVVSGPTLSLDAVAEAFDASDIGRQFSSKDLRGLSLSAVTIAECAVGLRIVCDVPDIESPLMPAGYPSFFGPAESDVAFPEENALWQWRFFPRGSQVNDHLVARRLRFALSICMNEVQSIQRAVQSIRRTPTAIATLERLPALVPFLLRRAADIGKTGAPVTKALLATGRGGALAPVPPPLTNEEMSHFNQARERVDGGAFAAHLDLHREAQIALDRLGDHRLAALLLGISAESLFDELLLHLLWEEAKTPELAARAWIEGLDSRVSSQFPSRLGGSWDFSRAGPIGDWARSVAALRNRVAHAGYLPSEGESQEAMETLNALVTHLCDRLGSPTVLRKYPRTALTLAGEQGLRRRRAYSRKIQALNEDPSEVAWSETFLRWRESWRRTRQDLTTTPRAPTSDGSWLLAVRHADRTLHWIRHNRGLHLAIETDVREDAVTQEYVDTVHALADKQHSAGYKFPISFGGQDLVDTPPSRTLWVEEFHHVPMTGVMVDSSDYDQPIDLGIAHN